MQFAIDYFQNVGSLTLNDQNCKQLMINAIATLLWENVRMRFTLPKWGLGSPPGLPKLQSSITRVKTPPTGAFFISLENYWSLDVENGLA